MVGLGVSKTASPKTTVYSQKSFGPSMQEIIAGPIEQQSFPVKAQAIEIELAKLPNNSIFCSCVNTAKAMLKYSYEESVGYAKNWPINSKEPKVGGIVITNESYAGHVAFIYGIEENELLLDEGNYISCKRSQRRLKIDDPIILGYWENN